MRKMPPPVIMATTIPAWRRGRVFDFLKSRRTGSRKPRYCGRRRRQLHYKFIPRTGALGEADAAYLEFAPPKMEIATGYGGLRVTRRMVGRGRYKFHHARWEDVPFQYPIINARTPTCGAGRARRQRDHTFRYRRHGGPTQEHSPRSV